MAFFTPLPHRALVAVRGDDRIGFLQGLVSNDMARVEAGQAVWAAFLTPQGKFLHEFFAIPHGETVLLECERARRDDLITRLSRYKLRAKVSRARASCGFSATDRSNHWSAALPSVRQSCPPSKLRRRWFSPMRNAVDALSGAMVAALARSAMLGPALRGGRWMNPSGRT